MMSRELAVAIDAASAASVLVRAQRHAGLVVEHKRPDAPVTNADRASSEQIVDALRSAFPGDAVVSEEAADEPPPRARRTWFVDPLDGTHEYIAGRDGYCIMIGLVADDVPILGVIAVPEYEHVLYAVADRGAWRRAPSGTVALRTSSVADLAQVRQGRGSRAIGMRLAWLAAGETELYVNPSARCHAWDTAAGHAIVRAAGGVVTDATGGPLRYDPTNPVHARGVLASNGLVHDAALAATAGTRPNISRNTGTPERGVAVSGDRNAPEH